MGTGWRHSGLDCGNRSFHHLAARVRACRPPTASAPRGAPNIVFITLDTVRADHLSSYGYSRPTTPNLDRFARTGVLFENATPEWQYIAHRDGREELYNWTSDPGEKDNLASSAGDQATLDGLRSHLISLVSDATGPWRGMAYLSTLDGVSGGSRLSLLQPLPLMPGSDNGWFRIGMAQAYFKPDDSTPARPARAELDLMRSLPYQ